MPIALPEDRGYGKLFWIFAGTVLTAIVGIPLVYLVNILTPKPHFDVKFNRADTTGVEVEVANTSHVSDAKSVIIGLKFFYDDFYQKIPKPISNFEADTRCHKYASHKHSDGEEISSECAFINAGESLRFNYQTYPFDCYYPPKYMAVSITYDRESILKEFTAHKEVFTRPGDGQLSIIERIERTRPDSCEKWDPSVLITFEYKLETATVEH